MKLPPAIALFAALTSLLAGNALAIPQNFGGGGLFPIILQPVDIDEDLTDELTSDTVWQEGTLPRKWHDVPSLDGEKVQLFAVNPTIFGQRPTAVFANSEEGELKSISVLYLDAGHFFGYRPDDSGEAKTDLRTKQREFKKRYADLSDEIAKTLTKQTKSQPRTTNIGRTAFLRTSYQDYNLGDLILRLSAIDGHSVSLTLLRADDSSTQYLDEEIAALDKRDRREQLLSNVDHSDNGDTQISGIPMFQQGQRPYCAISTLGMATHYLGLRLGTSALAAGAKFRNTGSAKGAKILDLYRAAAEESGATLQRGGKFDLRRAKSYIEKGYPIVVWRRYSAERDRLHSAAAEGQPLPPAADDDAKTWPTGKDAPGHASVITGFNEKTGEVIFSESWGEHARNKRMRAEELEATSYAVFYFKI